MAFLKWLSAFGNGHGLWALACDASGRRGEWPNAKRPSYRGASGGRSGSGLRAGEREYGPLSGAELGVAIKRAAMGAPAGNPSFAGLGSRTLDSDVVAARVQLAQRGVAARRYAHKTTGRVHRPL